MDGWLGDGERGVDMYMYVFVDGLRDRGMSIQMKTYKYTNTDLQQLLVLEEVGRRLAPVAAARAGGGAEGGEGGGGGRPEWVSLGWVGLVGGGVPWAKCVFVCVNADHTPSCGIGMIVYKV